MTEWGRMKIWRWFWTVLMGTALTGMASAADAGRYQAIALGGDGPGRGGSRVLIIDSQDGHVWTWSGNELIAEGSSGRRYGAAFIYQGKLRPGSKVGEIIDTQAR
jgi:hypothetical protein